MCAIIFLSGPKNTQQYQCGKVKTGQNYKIIGSTGFPATQIFGKILKFSGTGQKAAPCQ
jgi:hypothetical protein